MEGTQRAARCTECVTADRPVRAKAPPVPAASAPAPARRSAPLTPEEKESASRLSDGAPLTYKIHNNLVLAAAEAPPFVMPRVSEGSEPELRRLGRSLGLRHECPHYFFEDNKKNPGYGDVANMECIAADVSLAGVKFAFDRQYSAMTECDMGSLELICLLKKGRPFVIFKVGAGENSGFDAERRWPISSSFRGSSKPRARGAGGARRDNPRRGLPEPPRLAHVLLRRLRRTATEASRKSNPHTRRGHRFARGPWRRPTARLVARGAAQERRRRRHLRAREESFVLPHSACSRT